MTDLLSLAAELVDVPSVSHAEGPLADLVEDRLEAAAHLDVTRTGDTVVARTEAGRSRRLLLGGHLDTVPAFGDDGLRVEADVLYGLGAVDMKGGLAVLVDLALSLPDPVVDVTYVFYAGEEVERRYNGLVALADARPELLAADAAVLAEPTGGRVEAGCQGTLRARVSLAGRRAHTARPWTGRNAVHRLAPVLGALAAYRPRQVDIDGCTYTEQVQAVAVEGGVAGNVVPDRATVTVNHRFAPDRDAEQAAAALAGLVADQLDEAGGDRFEVVEAADGAPPALDQALLAAVVAGTGRPPRAKVGWTDVATLWALGVPATNYGPGDPLLAHTPDEHVSRDELEEVRAVLLRVVGGR